MCKHAITYTLLLFTIVCTDSSTHQHPERHANNGTIVIPAGGLGTRFLPFTKIIPKEMLPILNLPAIHYIVDEGKNAHFNHFAFVISGTKQLLKDYFSPNNVLEECLRSRGNSHLTASIQSLIESCTFDWHIQQYPKGLGHAIFCARSSIGDDFFTVILPDDLLIDAAHELAYMRHLSRQYNASVIAVQEVPKNLVSAYGIIKPKDKIDDHHYTLAGVVEKPTPEEAPSSLGIIGRYVLSSDIFGYLERLQPGAQGEIQLTDAILHMIEEGYPFIAYKVRARRFDLGTPHGWLEANNYLHEIR